MLPRAFSMVEPHSRFTVAAALVIACALQLSCSAFDVLPPLPDASANGVASCVLATVPQRPQILVSNVKNELVFAFTKIDWGEVDEDGGPTRRFETIGFDLDGTCTTPGSGASCVEPVWAGEHPDNPGGRDNALGGSLYGLNKTNGDNQTGTTNQEIAAGVVTITVRVVDYNQGRSDNQVEVAIYVATRSSNPNGAEDFVPPKWDGEDVWHPNVAWLATESDAEAPSAERPKYVDTNAYVNDWWLVAHFDRSFGPQGWDVSDVRLVARIQPDAIHSDRYVLVDGTYTGRIRVDDLLRGVPALFNCQDSPEYEANKRRICGLADIGFSASDPPSKPCDAASWAFSFEAAPAILGSPNYFQFVSDCPGRPRDYCDTLAAASDGS